MNRFMDEIVSGGLISLSAAFTALQTNEVFQTVSLVVTILSGIVSIVFIIWRWWKQAKKDGKVDGEDIGQLLDDLSEGLKDIKSDIDDKEVK